MASTRGPRQPQAGLGIASCPVREQEALSSRTSLAHEHRDGRDGGAQQELADGLRDRPDAQQRPIARDQAR
jgi:hypothetical protein